MPSFDELGLAPSLVALLADAGIDTPFPVQEVTLPDALLGKDVCAKAPTGSGKTLAYGLALLQLCEKARPRAPRALVLVPTRELAKQVADVLMPYGRQERRWVTAFFGGAGMLRQISDLQRGVDIAVATPGRLTDLVNRGEAVLDDVDLVVIDEADRMADMGFTPQVTWLLDRCAEKRQTLLFSATLDGDVDELVKHYMQEPSFHAIAGPDGDEDDEAVLKRARHLSVPTRHESKFQDLAYLVDSASKAIVFVKNRFATERVADALDDLGVRAVAMHGGMTQSARERALERWAQGGVKALVATDVAARGVHVDGVELVVHVDPPQDEKDYIHRSGRTARAGADGVVVSMLRKEQLRGSAAMFRRLGVEVESSEADVVRALVAEVRAKAPAPVAKAAHMTARSGPSRGPARSRNDSPRDRGPRPVARGADLGGRSDRSDRGPRRDVAGDRPSVSDRPRRTSEPGRPPVRRDTSEARPAFADRGPSTDRPRDSGTPWQGDRPARPARSFDGSAPRPSRGRVDAPAPGSSRPDWRSGPSRPDQSDERPEWRSNARPAPARPDSRVAPRFGARPDARPDARPRSFEGPAVRDGREGRDPRAGRENRDPRVGRDPRAGWDSRDAGHRSAPHRSTGPGHRIEHAASPGHRPSRPAWSGRSDTRDGARPGDGRSGGRTERPDAPWAARRGPDRSDRFGTGATHAPRAARPRPTDAAGAAKTRGVPRFDDTNKPLNRRARRLMEFGEAKSS